MKQPYEAPQLHIVCFAPMEKLSADPMELNVNLDELEVTNLWQLSRASGEGAISQEGDIFLPI